MTRWQSAPVAQSDHKAVPRWMQAPAIDGATPNVGGRPVDASPIEYAMDSANASQAYRQRPSQPSRPAPGLGQAMLEAEHNNLLAARQRTDPAVYDGDRLLRNKLGVVLPELSDIGRVPPNSFLQDGKVTQVDPKRHVVLIDPGTGQPTVFERNRDAEGTDVTEEPMWKSLGRVILPGFITGPVAGPQRATSAASATRGATTAQRAQSAADDLMSFERAQVPVFAPAFSSEPVRATAKGIADTKIVGAPVRNALEDTYQGMASAVERTADAISPTTQFDQAGATLQRGLDRFRTAGVRDIEPGVLAERGIDPVAPIQPQQVMSRGAQARAVDAAPIRAENAGGVAETARGVQVPAARPLNQTIISRRSVDDMTDAEVTALTRAPAGETSFAVRSEALYERAQRQLPPQMRADETANPQLLQATNTRNAVNALRAEQERTRIPGGVVNGRFTGLADRIKTNVTLPTLRAMRTAIGRELSNFNYAEMGLDRTQLNRLYAAISRDIEIAYQDIANRAHIASRRGNNAPDYVRPEVARAADRALYEFRRADRYFRQGVQRMDTFLNVVGANNPEMAARRLIQSALAGGKGDIAMFRNAMSALRPEERAEFASLIVRNLGRPNPSARGVAQEVGFSPSTFVTNFNKLDARARALLFPGEHGRAINDLFRVASRVAEVERFANTSNSGRMILNVGGLMAGAGAFFAGGWTHVLGAALGGYGMALALSRPGLARWTTRYLSLRARAANAASAGANRAIQSQLASHIERLAKLAGSDPEVYQLYRSVASDNGIVDVGDEEQDVEQRQGVQNPEGGKQGEFVSPTHGGDDTRYQSVGEPRGRFSPPMRLGGPKPADGAFAPNAPTPGNVPPQAEARSYNPSPSESAAFYVRQGAETLGVPPSQAERIGSAAGGAVSLLTPADDVSDAIETGSAASAAMAGLSFLPGFRASKKTAGEIVQQAETVFDRLKQPMMHPVTGQVMRFAEGTDEWFTAARKEIRELEDALKESGAEVKDFKFADLSSSKYWGNPKARSGERTRTEEYLKSLQKAVRRHIKEPYKGGTSVPAPTSSPSLDAAVDARAKVMDLIASRGPPFAIRGRRGFPTRQELKQLSDDAVGHAFGPGPARGAGPWDTEAEMMKVLREAYERTKRLPKPD